MEQQFHPIFKELDLNFLLQTTIQKKTYIYIINLKDLTHHGDIMIKINPPPIPALNQKITHSFMN